MSSPSHPSRPSYPTQHSFVVDLNNRPLYECERKPVTPKKRSSPVKRCNDSGVCCVHHNRSHMDADNPDPNAASSGNRQDAQDAQSQAPSPRKVGGFIPSSRNYL